MDMKQAASALGLTYRQANYLVGKNVVVPEKQGPGKPLNFEPRHLIQLRLAQKLQKDGFSLESIRMATAALNAGWSGETPEGAGYVIAYQGGLLGWQKDPLYLVLGEAQHEITDQEKLIYSVSRIAYEVWDLVYEWNQNEKEKNK